MKRMKLTLIFALCALMAVPVAAKSKVKVIAHRGYWQTAGSAQNSIRSIEKATEIGAFGSEFDVHLTADDVPVVHHDAEIQGIKIQTATYAQIKDLKLKNGEKIPTLEQYLDRATTLKKTKLIFELKSHSSKEREWKAAEMVVEMVKARKLLKRTEFIAFSIDACEALHNYAPKNPVYYLDGDLSPRELKEKGLAGMDYHYSVIQKNPTWVKESHDLKLKVNVWTVNKPELIQEMIDAGVDFLTTDIPEEALKLAK